MKAPKYSQSDYSIVMGYLIDLSDSVHKTSNILSDVESKCAEMDTSDLGIVTTVGAVMESFEETNNLGRVEMRAAFLNTIYNIIVRQPHLGISDVSMVLVEFVDALHRELVMEESRKNQ